MNVTGIVAKVEKFRACGQRGDTPIVGTAATIRTGAGVVAAAAASAPSQHSDQQDNAYRQRGLICRMLSYFMHPHGNHPLF
jgi:hypothetical protein